MLKRIIPLFGLVCLLACQINSKKVQDNKAAAFANSNTTTARFKSDTPSHEKPERNKEVAVKGIKEYFEAWADRVFSGDQAIFRPDLVDIDEVNGYCTFGKFGMASTQGAMALWRTTSGKDILGVFSFGCQGGSCFGRVEDIHFYDANIHEITDKLIPLEKLKADYQSKLDHVQARGAEGSESFFCQIPQKGTTVYCAIRLGSAMLGDSWQMPIAELTFDKQKGSFNYISK